MGRDREWESRASRTGAERDGSSGTCKTRADLSVSGSVLSAEARNIRLTILVDKAQNQVERARASPGRLACEFVQQFGPGGPSGERALDTLIPRFAGAEARLDEVDLDDCIGQTSISAGTTSECERKRN